MLDSLFMKYLTKKGKIVYWIIQLGLDIVLGFVLFGILDYSLSLGEGRNYFIIGLILNLLIAGGICLMFWKKPKDLTENQN